MLSAYADEAARLTLQGYDVERILQLTRWALTRLGELRRLVDHAEPLAEREPQVGLQALRARC